MTPFLPLSDVLPHLLRRLKRYKFHGLKDFRPYERLGQHCQEWKCPKRVISFENKTSRYIWIYRGWQRKTYKVRDQLVNRHFHACVSTLWTWSIESDILNYLINHRRYPIHSYSRASTPFLQIYRQIHPRNGREERVRLPTILLRHPPGFGKLRGSVETDA